MTIQRFMHASVGIGSLLAIVLGALDICSHLVGYPATLTMWQALVVMGVGTVLLAVALEACDRGSM